jgi:hypothetical protein
VLARLLFLLLSTYLPPRQEEDRERLTVQVEANGFPFDSAVDPDKDWFLWVLRLLFGVTLPPCHGPGRSRWLPIRFAAGSR